MLIQRLRTCIQASGSSLSSAFLLELQLLLANRARMDISVRYDDRGAWEKVGTLTGSDRRFLLPIRPKPCSHLELLLEGEGDVRLLSLTRVLRQGGTV